MWQAEYRFDRRARCRVGRRLIYVFETVRGNQPVERKASFHEQIDETGDEVARPAVALNDAAHGAPALQDRHLETDFGAGPGAADEHAGAEWAKPVDRQPEPLRHRRGFQCETRA